MNNSKTAPELTDQNSSATTSKPIVNPAVAVIITIVMMLIAIFISTAIGVFTGLLGFLLATIGSFLVSVSLAAKLFRNPTVTETGSIIKEDGNGTAKATSIGFIIFGLVVGFVIGALINFGGCYKSECSPLESAAPLYIPAASLIFTIPPVLRAFRGRSSNEAASRVMTQHSSNISPDNDSQALTGFQQANKKEKRGGRILLILTASILCFIAALYIIGYLNTRATNEDKANKSADAQQTIGSAKKMLSPLLNELTYHDETKNDLCYEVNIGDKWSANYQTQCAYKDTQYYGYSGDYADTLVEIEQSLLRDGWTPRYGRNKPAQTLVNTYRSRTTVLDSTSTTTPGDDIFQIASLLEYTKDEIVLSIDDFHLEDTGINKSIVDSYRVSNNRIKSSTIENLSFDAQSLSQKIFTQHDYMLVISLENVYYKSY